MSKASPHIVIACGGTGGHFFPGAAVGGVLREMGAEVTLLISTKKIDQQSARTLENMAVREIPAVGYSTRAPWKFAGGFLKALKATLAVFKEPPPVAVLAMGGFTSLAPVVLGRLRGVTVFLHESNAIPGRANRLLAPLAEEIFVGMENARGRFLNKKVTVTGTPVRKGFVGQVKRECRERLGLDPDRPVLLAMGGSQGALGINGLVAGALADFKKTLPGLQLLQLTGEGGAEEARTACAYAGVDAVVHDFLGDMAQALGAADVAVSRAGASSLAEMAAARLPVVLVPYPLAADDHQRHNARAFAGAGGGLVLEQNSQPSELAAAVGQLFKKRASVRQSLARMDVPGAAGRVAVRVLSGGVAARRGASLAVA
ncbi:MAG: hypothetical protein CMO74_11335 [Verrucomicrobiales bacterium]|nr:hypothetical protein [Verrucomicrobiales bacterium]